MGETTTRFRPAPARAAQGREHRRGTPCRSESRLQPVLVREPLVARAGPARGRAAQVVVGDALRARHQVEHERQGRLPRVARRVLEPLQARLRAAFCSLDHVDPALVLVALQRRGTSSVPTFGRRRRGRSHPPSPAWCPSRSRSARCAPSRRSGPRLPWCQRLALDRRERPPERAVGQAADARRGGPRRAPRSRRPSAPPRGILLEAGPASRRPRGTRRSRWRAARRPPGRGRRAPGRARARSRGRRR